jgi:beta-barrel assembly-enhancing protease
VKKRLISVIVLLACLAAAQKQKTLRPGFNFFSKEQDIQLGREAAAQVERQMQVINTPGLSDYVQSIGQKLASQPEADKYPYSFKVVNEKSINAFALPGGPTFVHTGLISAAENEAQLAGVLAHEISHVALRHGTHQVTKANFIQLGAGLLGAVGPRGILGQLAQVGIGLGANSLLLKYSRDAEHDADINGARIMAGAGYNPIEMAHFFEKLQAQSGSGAGRAAQFFSDHPNPGNRVQYVTEEVRMMPQRQYVTDPGPGLKRAQQIVAGLPAPPPRPKQAGAGQPGGTIEEARPAGDTRDYRGQFFAISYPQNWQVFEGRNANLTIASRAGVMQRGDGGADVAYGVMTDLMQTQRAVDLETDTQNLLRTFQQNSSGLKRGSDPERRLQVDGQPALLNILYSQSAYGQREVDAVLTVARPDGLLYFIFVAPESDYPRAQPVFDQMIQSIRLVR